MVPALQRQEGWPPALLGAVFSATPLGYGLGTLAGGRLADALPPRRLCWTGLGLLLAGLTVAFALPSGFTFLAFYGFLALGVGGGVALTGAVAALVRLFPSRAGTAGGAVTATYAASSIIQAPLIAALLPALGWLGALRLVGLASALTAGLLLLAMPALPAPSRPAGGSRPGGAGLLRRPAIWSGCLLVACGATLGPYAAVNLGADAVQRGLGAAVATAAIVGFALGNTGGRLAAGVVSDRLGVDVAVLGVLLLDLAGALLLALGASAPTLLAAGLAAGTGLGSAAGALARMGVDAAPDAPNSAVGMLFAAYAFGAVVGPLVGAAAGPRLGPLAAGAAALAGLGLLPLRRRLRA